MVLMIVSSVAISFGGLIMRSIQDADAWQINLYRAAAMAAGIGAILILQYRRETLRRIAGIGKAGVWAGLLIAVAGVTFIQAISNTTVANTMFTLSAIPFITAGLAWIFLKEPLARITLIAMSAAALGVTVMVADGFGLGSVFGNLMALATACGFAGFTVIVRSNRHIDMLPTLLVSSLMILFVAMILRYDDLRVSAHDLALCFLWGGVLSGVGNGMFIVASRHLVAAELTLFMLLEFALSPLWVWIFVGETPTGLALAGGALVIGSVAARALVELRGAGRRLKRGWPSPG
jgi:drug/metabolite transporter (DMT)-like permease